MDVVIPATCSSCIKVAARNSGGTFATQPERMRERIREIFVLARSAVEEELRTPENEPHHHPGANGHANGDGANGNGQHSNGRPATQSQVRAIYASSRLLGCSMRKPKPLCFQGVSALIDKKRHRLS